MKLSSFLKKEPMLPRHRKFRHVLGGMLVFFCLLNGLTAFAETGIRSLDTPAIPVKAPGCVTMDAITRVGHRLVAVGVHGVIVYSDDNGRSWKQANVPVSVLLTAVAFGTPSDGWAAGHAGVILNTQDGGVTWHLQLDGNKVNQLISSTARQALEHNPNSQEAQRAVRRAGFFVQDGPVKPFLSILAMNANDALVFGSYRMLVKTTDGGKTWADWSLHFNDPLSHNLYDAIWVGPKMFVAGEAGNNFISSDGGQTFLDLTPPSADDTTMFGAVDTGDNGVLVFGVAGRAFITYNDGLTWQPVEMNTIQNLTAGRVLASGTIVVTSQDGVLHVSYDHAKTFSSLAETLPMAAYDLQEADNGDVVVAGSAGLRVVPAQDFSKN